MRISDWSSDVCSSDLQRSVGQPRDEEQLDQLVDLIDAGAEHGRHNDDAELLHLRRQPRTVKGEPDAGAMRPEPEPEEPKDAADRDREWKDVSHKTGLAPSGQPGVAQQQRGEPHPSVTEGEESDRG